MREVTGAELRWFRANLGWIGVGTLSLMAGAMLLLATDSVWEHLVWLVDNEPFRDNPFGDGEGRWLRRGVSMWGWAGIALGATLFLLGTPRFRARLAARFFQAVDRTFHRLPFPADRYDRRFFLAISGVLAFSLLAHWTLTVFEDVDWLEGEDGVSEWWSVATYAVSAVMAAYTAMLLRRLGHPRLGVLYVGLAVAFVFGAMEELSWGQRLLGWSTPAVLGHVNEQGETSIHNVTSFNEVMYTVLFLGSALALAGAAMRAVLHHHRRVSTADFLLPSLVLSPALLMILIWRAGDLLYPANIPRLVLTYFDLGTQGSEIPEVLLGLCLLLFTLSNLKRVLALHRYRLAKQAGQPGGYLQKQMSLSLPPTLKSSFLGAHPPDLLPEGDTPSGLPRTYTSE